MAKPEREGDPNKNDAIASLRAPAADVPPKTQQLRERAWRLPEL
jgi:hypothetical protein